MLFKVVAKEDFRRLIELLLEENEVVGPRVVDRRPDGEPIHQYLPIDRFEDLDLGYEKTEYSAKTYFLPYMEDIATYHFEEADWTEEIRYRIQPRALVGLHACDINALVKLDQVLLKGNFPSPYYQARRRNTLVIGIDHEPCKTGFCFSVDADTVTQGFDLFLTDLGDRYFVAIGSDRGYNVLREVGPRDVEEADRLAFLQERQRLSALLEDRVPTHNLATSMDISFDSSVWKKWGDKCLNCGSCAMVCPTCYCYGVKDRISMDLKTGHKVKQLYSCNLVDFAEVAGPHNFRPTRESRLKYRYYHHHHGFTEAYGVPMCVGCNRCGDTCLAGINPPDVIRDLVEEAS